MTVREQAYEKYNRIPWLYVNMWNVTVYHVIT